MHGTIPPQLLEEINRRRQEAAAGQAAASQAAARPMPPSNKNLTSPKGMEGLYAQDTTLQDIITKLRNTTHNYDRIQLPSMGKFYDGTDGPVDGLIEIRPMTGEEEQILATPRFVKKGTVIDKIFEKCVRQHIRPEKLLGVDRTYMLIFLRGISYSQYYDVEIKCPECSHKFTNTIDLNTLELTACPDNFGRDSLSDVLPKSQLPFTYRLPLGGDENDVQNYRDTRSRKFEGAEDDTAAYRIALLLEDVSGVKDKLQIKIIANNLPISDLNYIRNLVNDPPFGVNTEVDMLCPSCLHEFQVDLPLESGFFFPRRKKGVPTE